MSSIHFSLDFVTPFGIGDQVYALHPPKEVPYHGGPAWPPYRHGTVSQVKLVFELNQGNGLIVKHQTEEEELHVERVVYTIVCPPSDHHQSAFTVECLVGQESDTKLFASEEELLAYQQTVTT